MNLKEKKNNENKNEVSKQLEREHNQRNGHHMEGLSGEEEGRNRGGRYREEA